MIRDNLHFRYYVLTTRVASAFVLGMCRWRVAFVCDRYLALHAAERLWAVDAVPLSGMHRKSAVPR